MEIVTGVVHIQEFYQDGGWADEPLTKLLGVAGEVVAQVFPVAEEALSCTGYSSQSKKPIAQCHFNHWTSFIVQLPLNLAKLAENNVASEKPMLFIFLNILLRVYNAEQLLLAQIPCKQEEIAHNCGLMVLAKWRKHGYATQLMQYSENVLKAHGYKAVVVETTNSDSSRVMEKLGYQLYHSFSYVHDFGLQFEDNYQIWYKLLTPLPPTSVKP